MTIWQRIAREPNALTGIVIGVYGVLVAFEIIALTATQTGAVTTLGGAAVIGLRWLVTPADEVVVQQVPGKTQAIAGPASPLPTGTPVATPERGSIDVGTAVLIAVLVLLVLVILGVGVDVR